MTDIIDGPRRAPLSGGSPKQLVVLLHGYGADGNDLIGLADFWRPLLPDAAFVSPDAPFPCGESAFGREWFPLARRDIHSIAIGIAMAAPLLDAFLDAELAASGVAPQNLALVGFSQGAMMALDVGVARPGPLAGILSYSGLVARPLRPAAAGAPPVLLYHGGEDPLIPPGALEAARRVCESAGLPVESHLRPGLAHGIDEHGLTLGARFLGRVFASATMA